MTADRDRAAGAVWAPQFDVHITAPDLSPWLAGNMGVPGVWSFAAAESGPHIGITSLVHGNEIAGAVALIRLLRGPLAPARGRLTLIFANLDAYARFDPGNPTASRFVDEDLNRVWDDALLDSSRDSRELTRARALRPLIDSFDTLLDLHSMLWPGDPLILCGPTARGLRLAARLGNPPLIVADHGHAGGRRLIDYRPFVDPAGHHKAVLVEAGQHWQPQTVDRMTSVIAALFVADADAESIQIRSPRHAQVTHVITASTNLFSFTQAYRGGEIVAKSDTLIAVDDGTEIRTPYDNCMLIMPSLRPTRGHTAVRLARIMPQRKI